MKGYCNSCARDVRNCFGSGRKLLPLHSCGSGGKLELICHDIMRKVMKLSQCSWDAICGCSPLLDSLATCPENPKWHGHSFLRGALQLGSLLWLSQLLMLPHLLLGLFPLLCFLVPGCLCSQGLETVGLRDTLSIYPVQRGMWSSSPNKLSCIKGLCSRPSSCLILEWQRNASFCLELDVVGVCMQWAKEYAKGVASYSL